MPGELSATAVAVGSAVLALPLSVFLLGVPSSFLVFVLQAYAVVAVTALVAFVVVGRHVDRDS